MNLMKIIRMMTVHSRVRATTIASQDQKATPIFMHFQKEYKLTALIIVSPSRETEENTGTAYITGRPENGRAEGRILNKWDCK